MLASIWTDGDAAEVLFLIAAVVFAIEAVLIIAKPPQAARFVGLFVAVGAVLVALGLLAL